MRITKMNKINEFINSGLYETLLKAVQERNVEIDNIVPFSLLDYDRERLVAARIEIEDLKALLSTNMEEATSFVKSKMQLDFDEEDEYPVGEEVIDDEKPRTINELPYYKNFLVAFLIEYYLLKIQPTELGKYLKRIRIAHASKYEGRLKELWKNVL